MTGAWKACTGGITERFTPHGLRRSFNDMLGQAHVDPVISKASSAM
jgi:integrase